MLREFKTVLFNLCPSRAVNVNGKQKKIDRMLPNGVCNTNGIRIIRTVFIYTKGVGVYTNSIRIYEPIKRRGIASLSQTTESKCYCNLKIRNSTCAQPLASVLSEIERG